jgi:hypothetical protein
LAKSALLLCCAHLEVEEGTAGGVGRAAGWVQGAVDDGAAPLGLCVTPAVGDIAVWETAAREGRLGHHGRVCGGAKHAVAAVVAVAVAVVQEVCGGAKINSSRCQLLSSKHAAAAVAVAVVQEVLLALVQLPGPCLEHEHVPNSSKSQEQQEHEARKPASLLALLCW